MSDPTSMPAVAPPVWENIPPELAARPQWLLWRFEPHEKPGKKPRKMPYYVGGRRRTGTQGDDEDRARLVEMAVVRRAYERGGWSGVGFAFLPADGLAGVDLDGAINEDGEYDPRHAQIVASCPDTYIELSPSGRGYHVIGRADTHTAKSDRIGVELFTGAQFFTITGRLTAGGVPALGALAPLVLEGIHRMVQEAKDADKAEKAAAKLGNARPPPAPASRSPAGKGGAGEKFWTRINQEAMASFPAWVPELIPAARVAPGGGYRATSKALGRDLEEDLAIHPNGIQDFGLECSYSPIDLVMEHLPAKEPREAVAWLAQRLGIEVPAPRSRQRVAPAGAPAASGATSDAAAGGGSGGPPDDWPPSDDGSGGAGDPGRRDVHDLLLRGAKGKAEDCRENVLYCLRHDPELQGLVALNLFTELQDKTRRPPWGGEPGEWADEDDLMLGEYLARMHGLLVRSAGTIRAGVQMAARENKHHPILERLKALEWDGTERLEHWMVDCLGALDRPYVRIVSRFFIMGMVARLLRPGCKFDYMLILQGDQGLGKSSAFRALADPYFMDTPFRIGDKDAYLSLQGVWLVEFSELEAMSKAESTAIKAFVSSMEDRFRPPYGSRMTKVPRRSVLAGTTNADAFLKDATGDRRFWPVHVTEVNAEGIANVRDQLFAEAMVRLASDDAEVRRYYPTRAEEAEMFQPEQDKWRMVDVWTDVISDYLAKANDDDPAAPAPCNRGFFTAQELFQKALQIKAERMDNAKLMQTRVANSMRELGFASVREPRGMRKRGYLRPGWEFNGDGIPRRLDVAAPQAAVTGASQEGAADAPI